MDGMLLYNTTALCPECLAKLPASVFQEGNAVFLRRQCPTHNFIETCISTDATSFINRWNYFHRDDEISKNHRKPQSVSLHLTDRCDMACPICFNATESKEPFELSLDTIPGTLASIKSMRVALFGGEPLVYSNWEQVIRTIIQCGKEPVLYTNALRLADLDIVNRLHRTGLQEIHIQFDGFRKNAYKQLRGADYLQQKLAAIQNCIAEDFRIVLEVTCSKETSPDDVKEILHFCMDKPQITGLVFRALGTAGRHQDSLTSLNPDEVKTLVQNATKSQITRQGIEDFQILMYKVGDLLGIHRSGCIKTSYYPVLKDKNGFAPVEQLVPLSFFQAHISPDAGHLKTAFLLGITGLGALRSLQGFKLGMHLIRLVFPMIRRQKAVTSPMRGRLLIIEIADICDNYNYEERCAHTCPSMLLDAEGLHSYLPDAYLDRQRKA